MTGHRTPKRRLTDLQRKVLWLLEEAGGADLPLILATLDCCSADDLEPALLGLIEMGLVELYRDLGEIGFGDVPLTEAEVQSLPPLREIVEKIGSRQAWWCSEETPRAVEGVMITDAGMKALTM